MVGDSVAATVVPGIGRAGIRVRDRTFAGCRIVRGKIRYPDQIGRDCRWGRFWRSELREYQPPVVVLISGVWDLFDVKPHGSTEWLIPGTRKWARYYETMLERAVEILAADGADVVVPTIPYVRGVAAGAGTNPASSYDPDRVRAANKVIKRLARRGDPDFLAPDLNRFLSPSGDYQDGLGSIPAVRSDGVHFNDQGATAVGRWLAPKLTRLLGPAVRTGRKPGPVRVLLIGDSITVNYESAAAAALARRGYAVSQMGIAQSSLLDAGMCDGTYARSVVSFVDPDVVVFESIGNYGLQPGVPPCKPRVEPGSQEFFQQWRAASRRNQQILTSRGAEFLWVLGPSVAIERKRALVPKINEIYRSVAGPRHGLIDGWNALGGAKFDPALRYDGQHLNIAGSYKMATTIDSAVR
jgi:lysophospholipase L1-like esterase